MGETARISTGSYQPDRTAELDAVCRAFAAEWLAGKRPRIEQVLQDSPHSLHRPLFRELLRLELTYRGDRLPLATAEEYRQRFPTMEQEILAVFNEAPTAAGLPSGPGAFTSAGDLPILPGYEILEQLPGGGMGVVYRARQQRQGRIVAVKMIRSGAHAGPQERARFRLEAEAVASLVHPHIVPIYEHGEWEGAPYFVMELADRGNLAQWLADRPMQPSEAAALLETLARTVQFVHERGIIHRDLKPANILLYPSEQDLPGWGVPKLADFGLAKRLDRDPQLTQSHAALGTPSYMAPEQAAGDRRATDPAVDVHGLGAILYEALTGQPPFRAETLEQTLHQVIFEEPRPPTQLRPDLPPDLEAICLKCLEKEPGRRFATAEALADELRRFLDGKPIATPRFGAVAWHGRLARRAGYEIMDVLGAGARGIVYQARHRTRGHVVALKVLAIPEYPDTDRLARFQAVAAKVAQVRHANLAEILDFGEQDGQVFLAVESLEHDCLAEAAGNTAEPVKKVAKVLEMLARAVHHAHQNGLFHGRLKPSKVRRGPDGTWKIVGFGLSQVLEELAAPGSPATQRLELSSYLAPEQVDGHERAVGPAADVYALGAMLYEVLAGRPPVLADTVEETLAGLRRGQPEPPRHWRPEIPRGLEAICLKCLARETASRYPNAAALAEDLRRFRSEEVLFVDDLDEWSNQERWARRAGYELVELLGKRREWFVYKARCVAADRLVVLTRLTARDRFVPTAKLRLRREANTLGGLRHPNFVQLYELGEQNDLPYFAREFVEGNTLTELVLRQLPDLRFSAETVETLAQAVHAAHAKGTILAGLRPSRVRVTAAGVLKITSVRHSWIPLGEGEEPGPVGELCWRIGHLAPEQLTSSRQRPDRSADVYALGALLFTLLTGRPPLLGPSARETMDLVQTATPAIPARESNPVPAGIASLCLRCLAKQPDQRPASALVLAEELRRLLREEHF